MVSLSSQLPSFLANKGFALRPFAFIRAKHCLVMVIGNSWIVSASVADVVIFTVRMWTSKVQVIIPVQTYALQLLWGRGLSSLGTYIPLSTVLGSWL